MNQLKILNLLNEAIDSEFVTRKWNIVNAIQNEIMMQQRKLPIRNFKI